MKRIKIIYEDENLMVVDKPAGMVVYSEDKKDKDLIENLIKRFPYLKRVGNPPRYGVVHRLDKETSGVLLIAKNNKALKFFQNEFKQRRVEKRYIALTIGEIKENRGRIETLLGRSAKNGKKQKIYLPYEPRAKGKRKAITEYKVLKRFGKKYTLVEVFPKSGRKHQIRVHFAGISHPIVGDKLYGFKNQPEPRGLERQFLHAEYLKITLPNGEMKEFASELPEDLREVLRELKSK